MADDLPSDYSVSLDTSANALGLRYSEASSCFFASPTTTLLGHGIHRRLPTAHGADLERSVRAALRDAERAGLERPVVVGALPFCGDHDDAVLYIPRQIERAGVLHHAALPVPRPAAVSGRLRARPEPLAYLDAVAASLERMRQSPLEKVVLSRALELHADGDIDQPQLLRNLMRRNGQGYTFAIDLPREGGTSRPRLLGASPELLVSRRGHRVIANPIAGTARRSPDQREDAARAAALMASEKDRHEHSLVLDAVVEALRPHCRDIHVPKPHALASTATLWHLSSRVIGELRDPEMSSLALAQALHPTPAVCGHPRELAHEAIRQLETHPRGLFTGMVGWCDAQGDGEWAVTIRCARVQGARAVLYAGAGIVPGSSPERELAETDAKFCTMLDAFGLGNARSRAA